MCNIYISHILFDYLINLRNRIVFHSNHIGNKIDKPLIRIIQFTILYINYYFNLYLLCIQTIYV